ACLLFSRGLTCLPVYQTTPSATRLNSHLEMQPVSFLLGKRQICWLHRLFGYTTSHVNAEASNAASHNSSHLWSSEIAYAERDGCWLGYQTPTCASRVS